MADQQKRMSWPRAALRWAFILALVGAAMIVQARRGGSAVTLSEKRALLGTWLTITVAARNAEAAREHLDAAFSRIQRLERTLSAHQEDSELADLNALAGRAPVAVSPDLFAAIRAGVEWHTRSRGTFDIAVGPLLNLWRTCAKAGRLPTDKERSDVRLRLGAGRIRLDPAKRTVRFPVERMRVDLGGLGKGYCAEEVVKLLRGRGVRSALVAVAGDIRALGSRARGRPWRVGVQDPREPQSPTAMLTVLEVADTAVSTSGNYQRYVEIRGKRYSHIVDPRTGLTADLVPSVTVVGPDALTTDVLGTALSVMGVAEGLDYIEEMPGIEALFVTFDASDSPVFVRSSGFAVYESSEGGAADYRR